VRRALLAPALVLALLPAGLRADPPRARASNARAAKQGGVPLPEYHADDASAAPVTEQNLPASERFWPYQVALARPWQPPGRDKPLPARTLGVLIRIEPSGAARIDFGRHGIYEVPLGETNLLEEANRVRRGDLDKMLPNFLLAIAPRLVDTASDVPRPLPVQESLQYRDFLCVFADPGAKQFPGLAKALAPLAERDGLLTILFPKSDQPDPKMREQLRGLGWKVPFVLGYMAEAYSRTLLPDGASLPFLMLNTPEGRVLFQSPWSPDALPRLSAALDALPAPPRAP
jgi:hypothetical protein